MKKVIGFMCAILLVGLSIGCDNETTTNNLGNKESNTENNEKVETKGNCTAIECIKKINPEHTVEQINEIIGFEGELVDEKYNKYYWELSEETGVTVTYYSGQKGTIRIDYDRDSLKNSKVDFSTYDELSEKIKKGITYEDFISYIGNAEGTVVEKSSYSIKYIWVDKDGNYLNGSFSTTSLKCTSASGLIK